MTTKFRLTLAGALACSAALAQAQPLQTKPDALLQIDMNRAAVIEKITSAWGKELPTSQQFAFKEKLKNLRADQLLAANISGSFDGVLEVIHASEKPSAIALASSSHFANDDDATRVKALGETTRDLIYQPINPCRLLDTRGAFSPVFAGGAYAPSEIRSYQVTGNCGVPAGAQAVVTQITVITPSAAGDIEVLAQGQTFGGTAAMVFQAGVYSSVSLIARLSGSNGQMSAQMRGPGGNVAMDITGYFLAPTREGDGLRIKVSSAGSPEITNGSYANLISGASESSTIAGGGFAFPSCTDPAAGGTRTCANTILDAPYSTIGGGANNQIQALGTPVSIATIAGGYGNTIKAPGATIGGGQNNSNYSGNGVIAGGFTNFASNNAATIGGGSSNRAIGIASVVPGGRANYAIGDFSFAAGNRAKAARAGSFVWADALDFDFDPAAQGSFGGADNTFHVRATGGTRFVTGVNPTTGAITTGCFVGPSSTGWSCTSDRHMKNNIKAISPRSVLDKLVSMPVTTWSMVGANVRQMGPMAQDFYKLFGLGDTDQSINSVDAQGVAFAAIQGLNQKLVAESKAKDATIATMQRELAAIKKKLGL